VLRYGSPLGQTAQVIPAAIRTPATAPVTTLRRTEGLQGTRRNRAGREGMATAQQYVCHLSRR
jgi:hypothetical protein